MILRKNTLEKLTSKQWEWLSELILPDGLEHDGDSTASEIKNRKNINKKLLQLMPKKK